jgi:uncharacterized protein YecE (DUF72 family)
MRIQVGTSGFAYKEWRGSFYPDKIRERDMLRYYAERLSAVEINNTFYRLPVRETLLRWRDQVPEGFTFVLKASQRITHRQRLSRESAETVAYLFETASALGERLGPVFFQTPPFLKRDVVRLREFLELVPAERPIAFEFRHESWSDEQVYALLRTRNAALVTADKDDDAGAPSELVATADWGYLRLRRCDYDDDVRVLQARGGIGARLAGDRALRAARGARLGPRGRGDACGERRPWHNSGSTRAGG